MSMARKLAALEKAAVKAGVQECRHCHWGLLRVDREDGVMGGWPAYEPVAIREYLDPGASERYRDPLSDADKARLVGWRDDDNWKPADLRCRWCGAPVSCTVLVLPCRPTTPGGDPWAEFLDGVLPK